MIQNTRKNKKGKYKKNMQKQINMKKCPTKSEMNEQVFFFLIWRRVWPKRTLRGHPCISKVNIWKVFFWYNRKEKLLFRENWKWSKGKMSSRWKRSRTQKIKQKTETKNNGECETWWTKTKWWKKDARNTWWKKKRECFSWERSFFFKEDFFGKQKRDKTNKRSILFAKNAWIEWKRMEKEEKKGDLSWKFWRRTMVRWISQFNWIKNNFFFSSSQQESPKCENWRNHFLKKKFSDIFSKKSNIEESKHNEKTHKERTKQEEEVKRKSKDNQLLFRWFFFRNKGIKKTFFKKVLKTHTIGKMFFGDHAWETVL